MVSFLTYLSGTLFVIFAVVFVATWNGWFFVLALIFQIGQFVPTLVYNYRKAKRVQDE